VMCAGTLIAAAVDDPARGEALRAQGAEVVLLPGDRGKVDLHALMRELARRGTNEVHVEAGHKLNGSLLREGLVDELLIYVAPRILGDSARGMFNLPELTALSESTELAFGDVTTIGQDLRIIAKVKN
jgi:diaminohydroxyphosphoribosylaminopyrimidine deaminase/5-amino-6-(5-phosphoribosylamino)uracil reductase